MGISRLYIPKLTTTSEAYHVYRFNLGYKWNQQLIEGHKEKLIPSDFSFLSDAAGAARVEVVGFICEIK